MKAICVVIPVYNSPYIQEVIQEVIGLGYRIIVVDDGSDHKVECDGVEVICHSQNLGKGAAILTGAKRALELGYNYFVTMDGDKQHIASEIEKLVEAYEPGSIVIGNRDFSSVNVPKSSKFGRQFSNFWVMLETGKKLGDTQSGFRIYPCDILDLPIVNTRFDFEIEVLALHAFRKGKIIDVDVACFYPPPSERVSHFDAWWDNVRLSLLHTKLLLQKYLLLRGFLWR